MSTPSDGSADMSFDESRRLLLGLAGVGGLVALAGMASAGPINPPAGPVGPTRKTLDEIGAKIDSRPDGIPIGPTTTPGLGTSNAALFRITQPGRYYFPAGVGTINAVINAGVLDIVASDVEVDLNGRTLVGLESLDAYVIRAGVSGQGGVDNITIRNGTLRVPRLAGWSSHGLAFANGIANAAAVENVRFIGCGIQVLNLPASGLAVRRCAFVDTPQMAILVGATSDGTSVTDCVAYRCTNYFQLGNGAGTRVERCLFQNDGEIAFSRAVDAGASAIVRDCRCLGLGLFTFGAIRCGDDAIVERVVAHNCFDGPRLGNFSVVRDCLFTGPSQANSTGLVCGDGSIIERVHFRAFQAGITATANCSVSDCAIEGMANGTGVALSGTGNRVLRNLIANFGTGVGGPLGSQLVINNLFRSVGTGIAVNATNSLLGTYINPGNFATQANPYANMYL